MTANKPSLDIYDTQIIMATLKLYFSWLTLYGITCLVSGLNNCTVQVVGGDVMVPTGISADLVIFFLLAETSTIKIEPYFLIWWYIWLVIL